MSIYYAACILLLAGAAQPDEEAIRNGLIARLEGLQQIVVKYDHEWIPTPSKRATEKIVKKFKDLGRDFVAATDPIKSHEEFWYLDGRMRHEYRVTATSLFSEALLCVVQNWRARGIISATIFVMSDLAADGPECSAGRD